MLNYKASEFTNEGWSHGRSLFHHCCAVLHGLHRRNVCTEDSVLFQTRHCHLGDISQWGELRGQYHNAFATCNFYWLQSGFDFQSCLIWKPVCNGHWHFLITHPLKSVKTLKKYGSLEHRGWLLTRPATLSWEAPEVALGGEAALSCWQESLFLQVCLHQAAGKRPQNLCQAVYITWPLNVCVHAHMCPGAHVRSFEIFTF